MDSLGVDTDGRQFENAAEMWREIIGSDEKRLDWYNHGVGYWKEVEASVEGVLGGYGSVNDADIKSSEAFLKTLLSDFLSITRPLVSLDCGSGIGRVTKNLLIRHFNQVDLLEPVPHFLDTARKSLVPQGVTPLNENRAVNFYCVPLQEFTPEPGRYDVIWVQWCIGHLTDDDFVAFFNNAKAGLKPGGLFVLKENIAKNGFVLDKQDHSVTRSDPYFRELFQKCGLHVHRIKDQKGFPQELFAVKMYALTTEVPKRIHSSRSKSRANNRPAVIM